VPGILVTNCRITSQTPSLADLTVSLLHQYGIPAPAELIGKDVLEPKNKAKLMFEPKIKVEKALYQKLKMYSEIAGYSSVEEFVHHALEKEIKQFEGAESKNKSGKNLKDWVISRSLPRGTCCLSDRVG